MCINTIKLYNFLYKKDKKEKGRKTQDKIVKIVERNRKICYKKIVGMN